MRASGLRALTVSLILGLTAPTSSAAPVPAPPPTDVATAPKASAEPTAPTASAEPTAPTLPTRSADGLQTLPLPVAQQGWGSVPGLHPSPTGAPGALADRLPVVSTRQLEVEPFELAAVTWTGEADVTARVRTRSEGEWSQWYQLPSDDDHAPDPGTAEAAGRGGTDPLIVGRSDAVQVEVAAATGAAGVPADLRLDLVDPGADPSGAQAVPAVEAPEQASARRPPIYGRAQWGADESLREEPPHYAEVRGGFVHHTVNANDYTAGQVPAIIRSIYRYHVLSRGWNDIGYNFLVDRFGRVWEGRYGGVDRAVVGAHTEGYNDDAFAVSAIGTYTETAPSAGMLLAYKRLFAWKFAVHGVDPRYRVAYDGETWPAIAGHRDAASTSCPGDLLYAQLGAIRAGTITAMGLSPSRDLSGDGRSDLLATRPDGTLWLSRGLPGGGLGSARLMGSGWSRMSPIVAPGDWDGRRHDDLVARRSDGSLWLYPGLGGGSLGRAQSIGRGWQAMNAIVAPGDWDSRGGPDLVARRASDGSMWLYPGVGAGGFGTPRQIGARWGGMDSIVAPGDFTGDAVPDLIARRASDASLWLFPGTRRGGFGTPRQIGTGWRGFVIVAAGDVNRDGSPDLVARPPSSGTLRLYPGDGRGNLLSSSVIGSGWAGFNRLM